MGQPDEIRKLVQSLSQPGQPEGNQRCERASLSLEGRQPFDIPDNDVKEGLASDPRKGFRRGSIEGKPDFVEPRVNECFAPALVDLGAVGIE